MTYALTIKEIAEDDLRHLATYIAREANLDIATRFLDAAQNTFEQIAQMPQIGKVSPWVRSLSELGEVRQWRIKGFEKHLVFYRITNEEIEILRVLHGKRDIPAIFGA